MDNMYQEDAIEWYKRIQQLLQESKDLCTGKEDTPLNRKIIETIESISNLVIAESESINRVSGWDK